MAKTDSTRWIIDRLERHHDRSQFDCGYASLDDWLKRQAGQHQRRGYAQTFVATHADESTVLGYYAISNHAIEFDMLPAGLAKGLPRMDVPAILIGRLAVDRTQQGQGLGSFLLADALARIVRLAEQVGIRAVEVHALDDSAKAFYEHFGFITLLDDSRHLCLTLDVLRKM